MNVTEKRVAINSLV